MTDRFLPSEEREARAIRVRLLLSGDWEGYKAAAQHDAWLAILDSVARQKPHRKKAA